MKKITLLAATIALALQVEAQAPKYVLFEHFTSATCGPCAQLNPGFYTDLINPNPNTVRHIAFHQNKPATGDPMYVAASAEITTVNSYYAVGGIPTCGLNGIMKRGIGSPVQYIQYDIDSALAVSSPIKIETSWVKNGSNRDITVKVFSVGTPPSGSFTLRSAIIERNVHYASNPCANCTNGERDFPNTFRKFAQSNNGEAITLPAVGQSVTKTYSVPESSIPFLNANDLAVISYIQNNSTKEVINSGSTFDPTIELTSTNGWAQGGSAGNVTTMNATATNTHSSINDTYTFKLTSSAPAGWSATFDVNGQTSSNTVSGVAINAGASVPVKINVTPGTTAGIGQFLVTMTSANNPTAQVVSDYYVMANVTDLVISNYISTPTKGFPSSWESQYTDAIQLAGSANYAATSRDIYAEIVKNSGHSGLKSIYYNCGWTTNTFSDDFVGYLTSFLNAGGNFFISGQDVGWDTYSGESGFTGTAASKAFYQTYLGAQYDGDGSASNTAYNAVTSDAYFGTGGNRSIIDFYYASSKSYLFPDEITPINGAVGIFKYANGKFGGLRKTNGTYKTVYFGVGVEQLSTTTEKNALLKLVYQYFNGTVGVEEFDHQIGLLGAYPNPSNATTVVTFSKLNENVTLQVLDLAGRLLQQQAIAKGTENATINTATLANGTYLYRVVNANGEIVGSKKLQVAH